MDALGWDDRPENTQWLSLIDINTFPTAAGIFLLQQLHLVLILVRVRTILIYTKRIATLSPLIGRHHLFVADVCGTGNWTTFVELWKLDNRQEMAGQTSCHRESNTVAFTPPGKCLTNR